MGSRGRMHTPVSISSTGFGTMSHSSLSRALSLLRTFSRRSWAQCDSATQASSRINSRPGQLSSFSQFPQAFSFPRLVATASSHPIVSRYPHPLMSLAPVLSPPFLTPSPRCDRLVAHDWSVFGKPAHTYSASSLVRIMEAQVATVTRPSAHDTDVALQKVCVTGCLEAILHYQREYENRLEAEWCDLSLEVLRRPICLSTYLPIPPCCPLLCHFYSSSLLSLYLYLVKWWAGSYCIFPGPFSVLARCWWRPSTTVGS